VLPADLEGDQPVIAQVDALHDGVALEVPEVKSPPVLAGGDIGGVEPVQERVRRAPLARDQRVLARLVPEVVHELQAVRLALPALGDREVACVEHREAARQVAVGVAQHRDRDDVAGHAVHGVGRAQPELVLDLLALDHVLDSRLAWLADVEDVDSRGAHAGHDQRVALQLGVARRGARVPTEVVELVADVGHLRAMDDLPIGG